MTGSGVGQQAHFCTAPVAGAGIENRSAVTLDASETLPADEGPCQQIQLAVCKAVLVLQLRGGCAVGLKLSGHQRIGQKCPRGIVFAAVPVDQIERPGSARDVGEKLPVPLAVQSASHARHARCAKVKKPVFTACLHARGGSHHMNAVVQHLAPAGAPLARRLRALQAKRQLGPVKTCGASRDHIDHTKHRVLPIHRAARAGNELDAFDQVHVQLEIPPKRPLVEGGVVDAVAIDGDQRPRVQVAWQAETPCSQVLVLPVIGGVHAGQAGQRLTQGAPAKSL